VTIAATLPRETVRGGLTVLTSGAALFAIGRLANRRRP
jgi:hypothetical protein